VLLNIKFSVKRVKLRARYGYGCSTESFPGRWQPGRWALPILVLKRHPSEEKQVQSTSPSTSTSPGTSPTSVAGQIRRKYRWMQVHHSPLLTTAQHLLLRKLEGRNDSIKRSSLSATGSKWPHKGCASTVHVLIPVKFEFYMYT